MKDAQMPRVGYSNLKSFINRKVLFVGRVENVSPDGSLVTLTAPDGSRVTVQGHTPFESTFVEVEGTVVDPQTIKEESHTDFSDNFDMSTYNEFLQMAHDPKYVDMFRSAM